MKKLQINDRVAYTEAHIEYRMSSEIGMILPYQPTTTDEMTAKRGIVRHIISRTHCLVQWAGDRRQGEVLKRYLRKV